MSRWPPPIYATADQIARAIVTACRLTGEDPIACVRRQYCISARYIAMDAILGWRPELSKEKLSLNLGFRSNAASTVLAGRRSNKWSSEFVAIVRATLDNEFPVKRVAVRVDPIAIAPLDMPAQQPPSFPARPKYSVPKHARITDHRVYGTVDLGDPAPGRSALDQKRAAEAAEAKAGGAT